MWDYQYVTLDDEQKIARRIHLDWAGYRVVLSQLVLCAYVAVYRWFTRDSTRRRSGLVMTLSRLEWRLSDPISLDRPEFRCWGDWLIVLGWAAWCTVLATSNTGNGMYYYMHVTKAFGIVGAANLPMHFLLAIKRSPLRWMYGLSYEGRANFLHRWLGRIILYLLSCHAMLYLNFFWDTNRMKTRFLEFDVMCGFIAFIIMSIIGVSANHYVRNLSYRVFYLLHIILSPLLFPLMFLHVSHIRPYLYPSITLFVGDQVLRAINRTPALASIKHISPSLIQISAHAVFVRPLKPGSHALLRHPATTGILGSNPFSITAAITPSNREKKRIRMIARVRSNITKKLAALPTEGPRQTVAVYLDLPYGAPLYFPPLSEFDKILFVAGGVGATFAVSWIKYLSKSTEGGRAALVKPGQLRFVWAVKSPEEAAWAFDDDYQGDNANEVAECVELYITGNPPEDPDADQGDRISTGRPSVRDLIHDTVKDAGHEGRTAILICGPSMMGSIAKRVSARLGAQSVDLWLHVEEFGH
ncbi:ferric reductase like transmembrane component-domain-containing protein [Sphaerosporella brunnea]|uniref:Ferric reductase like transmembrane component-domain-containing protein n=1 Tax=Sphaerosporella brunnea TaxID=1250544 RepID=A0A5J5F6Y9_9PEZI|nr:ferric reductase like transmembrane component-domain-containing protein [Sphaerosporella brunnea]